MPRCDGAGLPAQLTTKVKIGRDAGRRMAQCPVCGRWMVATDTGMVRWHKIDLPRKT